MILCRLALMLALVVSPALGEGESFVAGTGDVPLMPGLVEDAAAQLVWDKPEGRIVEAEASGEVAAGEIEAFYRATLPQLGWIAEDGALSFVRGEERLAIRIVGEVGGSVVRFVLEPR